MKRELTIKQKITLESIEWYIKENGYPPTIREIAQMTKTDVQPAFAKLMQLEEKGYIKTGNGKSRAIKILKGLDDD